MSININNNYTSNVSSTYGKATTTTAVTKEEEEKQVDKFEKSSTTYSVDMDKVNAMKADLRNNTSAFATLVKSLMKTQGGYFNTAMGLVMDIDEATQLSAQQAISEDGEWGVENTAQRIFDFAQALSGGDPEKAEELREAVKKGFAAAEKAWGGELPGICGQTYNRIMEMFDDWVGGTKVSD